MNHIRWYLLLLVVFFSGDRLGGYALQHLADQSRFRYTRLYAGEAAADILLLGNSRGLAFYQPYIEQITGKSTFNLSYNGLPMDAAAALVSDYLERYPAPKTLVIDITMCDRENDALLAGFLTYAQHSDRLNSLIRQKTPQVWWGGQVSRLFCFNHEIFQRALYYRTKSDTDWLLDRVIAPEAAVKSPENSYHLDLNPYLIQQLQAVAQKAREHGVQVELVIGPYFPGFQVNNLDSLKQAVEQATGLAVRNYQSSIGNPAFFGDFMHPNKGGSQAFIDMMRRDGVFD